MRFDTNLTLRKEWIPVINFSSSYEIELLDKFKDIENANELMLELLMFFNSSIKKVDIEAQTYIVYHNGTDKILPINRLSRGEKFLAMCLIADKTESVVYLSYELTQLAKPTILKLICDYKDSEYINLVPPTPSNQHLLESLLRREIE